MQIESSGSSANLETSDIVAIVLSIFLPGVGHILLGQKTKGLAILAAVILSCGVGYLVSAIVAIDAYLVARVQKERAVGEWEILPEHKRLLGV
jgi:TM2 domain-containing membrane protein YozV